MTLEKWIIMMGPKKVAKLLNVEQATVSAWRNYKSCPRPKLMKQIKTLTGGRVTYATMVEKYVAAQSKVN